MSAQIIPFPKLSAINEGMAPLVDAVPMPAPARSRGATSGLHLVAKPAAKKTSQQAALQIVADVCAEHNLEHPSVAKHHDQFWSTLPLPPARVETPVSVVRRLAHMLVPALELA